MIVFLGTVITILCVSAGAFVLFLVCLCASDSKECYECGERLTSHNIKRFRINCNKGFCSYNCKDHYLKNRPSEKK